MRRLFFPAAVAGALVLAAPAGAATVTAPTSVDRSCTAKLLRTGTGYVQKTILATGAGTVTARLDGTSGDWDLAVFDTRPAASWPARPTAGATSWPRASRRRRDAHRAGLPALRRRGERRT